MNKINIVQNIKDKEMDRKDFLKYSGLVLLSVVGLKKVIDITNRVGNHNKSRVQSGRGFGGGRYGV